MWDGDQKVAQNLQICCISPLTAACLKPCLSRQAQQLPEAGSEPLSSADSFESLQLLFAVHRWQEVHYRFLALLSSNGWNGCKKRYLTTVEEGDDLHFKKNLKGTRVPVIEKNSLIGSMDEVKAAGTFALCK